MFNLFFWFCESNIGLEVKSCWNQDILIHYFLISSAENSFKINTKTFTTYYYNIPNKNSLFFPFPLFPFSNSSILNPKCLFSFWLSINYPSIHLKESYFVPLDVIFCLADLGLIAWIRPHSLSVNQLSLFSICYVPGSFL